ncbi:TonB-dependent receptor plug domain-containing protein [Mesonia aquimarina]|uniref:TonB-dependent receptor plug domain-containing protein n=1 Tax=Mesonia aquimarina TaxID=1504967 RepID=UPI000EF61D06|nr:TonB-dependent receptor plug domain-containing protein [Mesonia aquimarina]
MGSITAQTQEKKLPLTQILTQIEKRFNIKFSYANRDVKKIELIPPDTNLSFNETMTYLNKQTNFLFQAISNNIIAIQKKKDHENFKPVEKLEEVMLTNFLAKGINKKNNGVFEINYKNFGILPGLIEPDALQTLQALPGVESVNETVSNINVRGGTNDQNLILWDGIRMYQYGHFFGLISSFNPYQTKKVSLIKNGTNPAFGNSVSSVISMETEKDLNKNFYGEVGVNFISTHGFVDTPLGEKSSIQVSARNSINGFFITPTYYQYYDRAFQDTEITSSTPQSINSDQDFNFFDASVRWLYDFSDQDKLRVNFIYTGNDLAFTENALIGGNLVSRESSLSQKSLGFGIHHNRTWSNNFESSTQFYYSNYNVNGTNADVFEDQRVYQENNVNEFGLKINTLLNFNKYFQFQNGYEFIGTNIRDTEKISNPSFMQEDEESLTTHALFSSIKYRSDNKQTRAEIGGRFNYFNKFNLLLAEPRITFNQRFLDFFTLEVLGELKSQTTTQIIDFETDFLGIEKRRWQLANQQDIPILKSKQLSLGLRYYRNQWLFSAEAYTKKVDNISSQSQGFQNQYQYAQIIGDYTINGIDFLVNKRFENLSAWISYSLTNNNYIFDNLGNTSFPNNVEIINSLSVAASYNLDQFKFSGGINWRSGKPFTPLTADGLENNIFQYEEANSSNLKNYLRVDVSASKEFNLNKNLDAYVGISIWNLLDRKNIINAYYERPNNNDIELIEQEALGLTPNFVFRLKF